MYSVADLATCDSFAELKAVLAAHPVETIDGLPPFQGGLAGMFGYEMCHAVEKLPRPLVDEFEVPALAVGMYDWVIAFDHIQNRSWVISQTAERMTFVRERLKESPSPRRSTAPRLLPKALMLGHPLRNDVTSVFSRESYLDTVRRAIEYVHAGDCFQVNIAQRLLAPARLTPIELYLRSRERNPAPFAGYFDIGDFQIVSASPERFLCVNGRDVETRPIKGTRPRGRTPTQSAANIRDLQSSPKDRAENIMIVDLLRNDLGRVCEFGSVRVPTVCAVETYRHVHHLISIVTGKLRDDQTPIDLLKAAFPGGSVTGAPKVRAMEIIAELEPVARGAYCGSLGFLGFDGSMDTNILIRTFTVGRGWIQFPVGGGIVADSDPQTEYEETLHKAEGLLRTLE